MIQLYFKKLFLRLTLIFMKFGNDVHSNGPLDVRYITTGWHTNIYEMKCATWVSTLFKCCNLCIFVCLDDQELDIFHGAEANSFQRKVHYRQGRTGCGRARSLVFSWTWKKRTKKCKKWWVATLRGTYVDTDNFPTDEPVKHVKTRMKTFFKGPLATKDRKP